MATSIAGDSLPQLPGHESSEACLITRLPILDAHNTVFSYELVCRGGFDSSPLGAIDEAGSQLAESLERLSRGLQVFIPRSAASLVRGGGIGLPAQRTVMQLASSAEPTPELIEACRELRISGHGLALDEDGENSEFLTEFANYIKVDFAAYDVPARKRLVAKAKSASAKLVATNVQTQEQFTQAKAEGFDLFEGYYFTRSESKKGQRIPGNKLVHLEILELVQSDPYDLNRLSQLVSCDPSLTFRLLRLVNSPMCAVRQEVTSIQSALLLVGQDVFRHIASMAIATDLNADQSAEILRMALVRSRFCELAATQCNLSQPEQYLLGMVSLFPAMLGVRIEELVKMLPLRKPASDALLGKEIVDGALLRWITAIEQADWTACDTIAAQYGLKQKVLARQFRDAIAWAEASLSSMA